MMKPHLAAALAVCCTIAGSITACATLAAPQYEPGHAEQAPALTPERLQELLFDAARLDRADVIPALAPSGVDLNGRDARGFTPLILAAYNGSGAAVAALIAAGADVNLADARQGNTALMGVAFKGHDAIARQLVAAGADVNARNKAGQTALMMASLFNRAAQAELLLSAGADPAARDAAGKTAADVARTQDNAALLALLEAASPSAIAAVMRLPASGRSSVT